MESLERLFHLDWAQVLYPDLAAHHPGLRSHNFAIAVGGKSSSRDDSRFPTLADPASQRHGAGDRTGLIALFGLLLLPIYPARPGADVGDRRVEIPLFPLPIMRTPTCPTSVDPGIREAASAAHRRDLGQRLRMVELPIAVLVILAGAHLLQANIGVMIIAATIMPAACARFILLASTSRSDMSMLDRCAVLVSLLAIFADLLLCFATSRRTSKDRSNDRTSNLSGDFSR